MLLRNYTPQTMAMDATTADGALYLFEDGHSSDEMVKIGLKRGLKLCDALAEYNESNSNDCTDKRVPEMKSLLDDIVRKIPDARGIFEETDNIGYLLNALVNEGRKLSKKELTNLHDYFSIVANLVVYDGNSSLH